MPTTSAPSWRYVRVNGRTFVHDLDRSKLLPLPMGGDSEEDPPDPGDGATTLTQAQVDAIVKKRVGETQKAEKAKFDAWLKAQADEADAANQDELTKTKRERDDAKAKADAAEAAADKVRLQGQLERKLLAAGVAEESLDRAVRLVDLDGLDADGIAGEVEALKKELPGIFAETSSDDGAKQTKARPVSGQAAGGSAKPSPKKAARSMSEVGRQIGERQGWIKPVAS